MAKKIRQAPADAEAPKEVHHDIDVVFVGTSEVANTDKMGVLLITLDHFAAIKDDGLAAIHAASSLFDIKPANMPRVACGIYKAKGIKHPDTGRITRVIANELKWAGDVATSPNSTLPVEIKAAMQTLATVRRMKKLHKDAGRKDLVAEHIEPLRRLWLHMDAIGRAALEAVVLRALRGGGF